MCGICGTYNESGVDKEVIGLMMTSLAHRGPDGEGIYLNGHLALGSRRLSIIDIPGGRQPITNEGETVWVVFNGEIYNYRSLRGELESKGHQFRTQSDTEVIVHLYEEHGERFVHYLNGMFAIVLWDDRQQKLILTRDRLGQKPLFYTQVGDDFFFASEIKALLATSRIKREIDLESMHYYLSLRFLPSPRTMLCNVNKLPPAHMLVFQNGAVRIQKYWDLSFLDKVDASDEEYFSILKEKLVRSVESHLVSDVPVGSLLSGGLDSSMIVAIMAQDLGRSFQTFSIGVTDRSYNELPYARLVADRHHTHHTERIVELDLIRSLPKMIWQLDEPSDPIAACFYQAAELASKYVKVVLCGDGGDELFAGFDRYRGVGRVQTYARLPALLRRRAVGPAINLFPDSFGYKNLAQKLRWMHQLSHIHDLAERYAEATLFFRFNQAQKRELFSDVLWREVGHVDAADVIVEQYNQANAIDPIDRMLYADYKTRLSEHSLMLTDRMAMAHGLEPRSPYLDHELVELMATFPSRLKINGQTTKYILRGIATEYLPDPIIKRDKQGFMFPIASWFRNELYPFVKGFLMDSHFVKEGMFNQEQVLKLIEEHRSSKVDHHVRLWMLLNLEIWRQIYIEEESFQIVEQKVQRYLRSEKHRPVGVIDEPGYSPS